jgi:hypothetical protein
MIKMITIYSVSDGRFIRTITADESQIENQTQEGEAFVDGIHDGLTQYVLNEVVENRPIQNTTVSGTSIVNLPINAEVTIAGQTVAVPDGTLTLNFAVPGIYPFKVVVWPYLDYEGVINYGA